jgi:hypothetical protein
VSQPLLPAFMGGTATFIILHRAIISFSIAFSLWCILD